MNILFKTTAALFLLFFPILLFSFETGDSTRYLTTKDTVFLTVNDLGEKIYEHRLEKKQTLYSLARFYGMNVEELYPYNPDLKIEELSPGQVIRIPIPNAAIRRFKGTDFKPWKFANVYYLTKKGDTMYKIAKTYFHMPVDSLKGRNKLTNDMMSPGIRLHVGWISTAGIPDSVRAKKITGGNWQKNIILQKDFQVKAAKKVLKEAKGVAYWQLNGTKYSELYCLHRTSAIGSSIAVTNPMKNRTVYAKVIGRVPEGAYGNDIIIVLSPTVAQMLGAIDSRFYVKLKYYE